MTDTPDLARLRWWVGAWARKLARVLTRYVVRGGEKEYLVTLERCLYKHELAKQRLKACFRQPPPPPF